MWVSPSTTSTTTYPTTRASPIERHPAVAGRDVGVELRERERLVICDRVQADRAELLAGRAFDVLEDRTVRRHGASDLRHGRSSRPRWKNASASWTVTTWVEEELAPKGSFQNASVGGGFQGPT